MQLYSRSQRDGFLVHAGNYLLQNFTKDRNKAEGISEVDWKNLSKDKKEVG
jgi:hypothetical protein